MNNPFDYIPGEECRMAYQELADRLGKIRTACTVSDTRDCNAADLQLCDELASGKMLGVLLADDPSGIRHTLFAFSGQIGDSGFYHPWFVEPVFDYLNPGGWFKCREREIAELNRRVAEFSDKEYADIKNRYDCEKRRFDAEYGQFREKCRCSKAERDLKRKLISEGVVADSEMTALIKESQFEKAELRRMKQRHVAMMHPLEAELENAARYLTVLKEKRAAESTALQQWLFNNFKLSNALGESRSLSDIFADTPLRVPPSGAGECCAPKLIQAAYSRGWTPVSIAEYWYGSSKRGEVRIHGQHYPACRGKCLPILRWMLRGLEINPPLDADINADSWLSCEPEILFENEWFCVVSKPAGMLSVPGKGNRLSLQQWLQRKYGCDREIKVAHRLDQDTSGLIVATFGESSYRLIQKLFATRQVHKTYVADLEGDYRLRGIPISGRISLPLAPDWLDRPRQRVDQESGKEAVTDYKFVSVSDKCSRVLFQPHTGRTHQLRVHAAAAEGFGMPILGDRLYGSGHRCSNGRMHLHAHRLEFTFPIDNNHYSFESPIPF